MNSSATGRASAKEDAIIKLYYANIIVDEILIKQISIYINQTHSVLEVKCQEDNILFYVLFSHMNN